MSNEYRIHPPESDAVTAYDRRCFKLYIVLIDADVAGTDWSDAYREAFGREIDKDRKKAIVSIKRILKEPDGCRPLGTSTLFSWSETSKARPVRKEKTRSNAIPVCRTFGARFRWMKIAWSSFRSGYQVATRSRNVKNMPKWWAVLLNDFNLLFGCGGRI
ncbi:MAG: hypothetical protein AB3N20_20840 [Rhizobiaceae bacterium]